MFKKLLAACLAACSISAFATTTVPIVWPFSPASNQANALRTIIENANKAQNKYTFIFENKPGGGGVIAVNTVLNSNKLTVLMTSEGVFTRPIYFPNDSYNIDDLEPVAMGSMGSPVVVMSKKYSALSEIKDAKYSLGIVSGGFVEAIGRTVAENFSGTLLVPYQGTLNATQDTIGGHIDATIEFVKDAMPWVESKALNPVAVTGKRNIGPFKTFGSQGYPQFDNMTINYYFLVNKSVSEEVRKELNSILDKANNEQNIKTIWAADHAFTENRDLAQSKSFWQSRKKFWYKK